MKRLRASFLSDIRYQWRYGFYLIYGVLSVCFIVILHLLPESWRRTGLSLMLLSDPAVLGMFFIGGLLQLERGEGILDALFSTPLQTWEYIAAKALSLGFLSISAGCLIALGSGVAGIRYGLLMPAMLLGSTCFTLIGVSISVNLRGINAFLLVHGIWEQVLMLPPVLLLFGVFFSPLEFLPGSIVLRLMQSSVGSGGGTIGRFLGLAAWTGLAFLVALKRLNESLSRQGGKAI